MMAWFSDVDRSPRNAYRPFLFVVCSFSIFAILSAVAPASGQSDLIFADGFESGDALAWSAIVPALEVTIVSPVDDFATTQPTLEVSGTFLGSPPTIEVNGVAALVEGNSFVATGVPLVEGDNTLVAIARNSVGQEASDSIVVHLDSTPTEVVITSPSDGFRTTDSTIEVTGTLDESVPVEVNGIEAVVDGLSFSATVPLIEGVNLLVATAELGSDSVTVVRDTAAPVVMIVEPTSGSSTQLDTIEVLGTLDEPATVTVNGIPATVTDLEFTASIALAEGSNVLTAVAIDDLGNSGMDSVEVILFSPLPMVTIDTPLAGTRTAEAEVEVTGTADAGTTVQVNGVPATLTGTVYTVTVPLSEGSNTLVAQATDGEGLTGTVSVQILRDSTPPLVSILSPQANGVVSGSIPITSTVTGTIHDAASGAVNPEDCVVTVNGIEAEVANGGWAAFGVPIALGEGTITVVATDSLGNSASTSVSVVGNPLAGSHIASVSGDGQSAELGTELAQSLVTRLLDNAGNPVSGVDVTFTVARGDGFFASGERSAVVTSDGLGEARVDLTLGRRAGVATDRVEASAEGFLGTAEFCASATVSPAAPRLLLPSSGFNQVAAPGSATPAPLVVQVTDPHGNPVAGESVTFEVVVGGGLVDGATSTTVASNDDGRASVAWTLGAILGVNAQEVLATVAGALEGTGTEQVRFAATAVMPGPPQATTLGGVVSNNENEPVVGAIVRLADTDPEVSGTTDSEGDFVLTGAPPGPSHLLVEDPTGSYAPLEIEWVLVAGIDNRLDRPVYLPRIDDDGIGQANLESDVSITRADIPGFGLTITAGSATFEDGSQEGAVQVVPVNSDKIPMVPENGTLPSLPISIQPGTVRFDPPASLRLPNVEGHAPGAVITLDSFDHDVGEFVAVATLRVSEDGAFLESEPGQGIVKGGWHAVRPTPPQQRTNVLNRPSLIRCVDAANCFKCALNNGVCDCGTSPYNGADAPISTPDFDCFLFPSDPGGNNAYPCDLTDPVHWMGEEFTPDLTALPPGVTLFKPEGSLCQRLYEPPPEPFTGVPGDTQFRCRFPTVDNPFDLPVCCPDSHWDGTVCSPQPACTGNDADNDRLEDCIETNTGIFVDATDTGTDPNKADTDEDGISDGDEVLGTVDGLDLPGMGTHPLRQDILLEYDWFDDNLDPGVCQAHSHRPSEEALDRVTTAFANSPKNNPDGSTGIQIIHDYGQGGLFTGGNLIADPDGVLDGGVSGAEYQAYKTGNFAANRRGYFHYVLLPHRYDTDSGSSGQAEVFGNDMIVSLQCFLSDSNVANTIMHELGHNLGLLHGGDERCNYKPNYNSVMNYLFQFPGVDADCEPGGDGVLDYAYGNRHDLDENSLDETEGLCDDVEVDWNTDGVFEGSLMFDINTAGNGTCGGDFTVLEDHNDWGVLWLLGVNDPDRAPFPEVIDCDNRPIP